MSASVPSDPARLEGPCSVLRPLNQCFTGGREKPSPLPLGIGSTINHVALVLAVCLAGGGGSPLERMKPTGRSQAIVQHQVFCGLQAEASPLPDSLLGVGWWPGEDKEPSL